MAASGGGEDNARAKNVFVLAVHLTIKQGSLELFKERWGVLAAHCRSGAEPNCLSYELCVKEGTQDSAAGTELLIYERYVSKADLEVTHNASAPFKAFGKWLNEESMIVLAKSKALCVTDACAKRRALSAYPNAPLPLPPRVR
jgi:quinol monooxygenase YgiN